MKRRLLLCGLLLVLATLPSLIVLGLVLLLRG